MCWCLVGIATQNTCELIVDCSVALQCVCFCMYQFLTPFLHLVVVVPLWRFEPNSDDFCVKLFRYRSYCKRDEPVDQVRFFFFFFFFIIPALAKNYITETPRTKISQALYLKKKKKKKCDRSYSFWIFFKK